MFRLGINTGFAVNRYSEPQEWTKILNFLDIKYAQFTADLLNVSLPDKIIKEQIKQIKTSSKENGIIIQSAFTGAFTRLNHLAHPNKQIRNYWIDWFKRFIDVSIELGAKSIGSHLGILTARDNSDPLLRDERVSQNIECWHIIGAYAKKKDLEFISWEPMSISREQGETISQTEIINYKLNKDAPIPFKICLDLDHGDQTSGNPDDSDPYKWLNKFAEISPQIHLKQSLYNNPSSNYPFLKKYNENGRVDAKKVINILKKKKIKDVDLILELNFKERNPIDKLVVEHLNESVVYWKKSLPMN